MVSNLSYLNNAISNGSEMAFFFLKRPGGIQFQDTILSVENSYYKDKTSQPSYLYNENPIPGKMAFTLKQSPLFYITQ